MEDIERQSVDDWMRQLFGEEPEKPEEPKAEEKAEGKEENEGVDLKAEVEALRSQLALMQLNAVIERVRSEFYSENPHLRDFADIIEKLASARISEIFASGKQLDDWSKVPAFIKGVLTEVGKGLEERLGLKKSSAAGLVGIPPAGVEAPAGEGELDEFAKYPGVDFPAGKNMSVRIISEDDIWKWRRDTAKKYVEERLKELRKRQQGWVEGYSKR
jgi:hypothetical protein